MDEEIVATLIKATPAILQTILIAIIFALLYRPIRRDLLPRLRGVQVFGLQLTFLQEELKRVAEKSGRAVSTEQTDQVARRAFRSASILQGAKLLWVDDRPSGNNFERRFLNSVGILVDIAQSSEEAFRFLRMNPGEYNIIISDMERYGDNEAGMKFLRALHVKEEEIPVIFYVLTFSREHGAPAMSFGMTNRPDELMNLIMDSLERERG